MRFVDPVGLVAFSAFAEAAILGGIRVELLTPYDDNVARYMSRMRLASVMESLGVRAELPTVRASPLENTLVELTRFDGISGLSALSQMVHRLLEQKEPEAANALHTGLVEAGANVIHHSGRDGGFLAAQLNRDRTLLQFAVSDSGVGMLETLRLQGASSHARALHMSVQRGISEDPQPGRGVGLFELNEEITELGGSLQMVSGNAYMRTSSRTSTIKLGTHPFPGTIIQGVVPI